MKPLQIANYKPIHFYEYPTLVDKMEALYSGETLFVKDLEQTSKKVLVRLDQKKFDVTKIAYNIENPEWVIYNVGLNDLSLSLAFRYDDLLMSHKNKYMTGDVVTLKVPGGKDALVVVEEVFQSTKDPDKYAYRLSDLQRLYSEDQLLQAETA